MCGIVGWFNLDSSCPANAGHGETVLRAMCRQLRHRGPDEEGIFVAERIALGVRRLAVIDLHTGTQPVFNEDRSIAVILNGEIYNFRELRRDLEQRGHQFRGHSDTEVLPHLYEEYGAKLVEKLQGMFALVLWDAPRRKLLMARDRFGEKPFYYGIFAGKLIFASELKALTVHPDVETRLDRHALRQFLALDYFQTSRRPHADHRKRRTKNRPVLEFEFSQTTARAEPRRSRRTIALLTRRGNPGAAGGGCAARRFTERRC